MRHRSVRTCLVFVATLFIFQAHANVVGTHMQNFNPTTSGLDFVTVHSTKTLPKAEFALGVWANYSMNSLPFFKAPGALSGQTFSEPNDKLLSGDLNLGLGIFDNWDIGLSLPTILNQDIDSSTQLGAYDDKGLTEIRLNSKYRFYAEENWALAVVGSINFDRIKNNPFSGTDSGPTWNVEGVFDYVIQPGMLWAVNLGYRLRDEGQAIATSDVLPLSDQILYSSALSYMHTPWDTTFIFEVFGSSFTKNTPVATDRSHSNLEVLAGAKYQLTPKIATHAGIATEAYRGHASPDLRVYLGMLWMMGPIRERVIVAPEPEPVVVQQTTVVQEEQPTEVIVLSSINFHTKLDEMTAASRRDFQPTIEKIKNNTQTLRKIIVEGHTDSRGTDAYNVGLSQRRANSVARVLKGALGEQVQIEGVGKGESRPVDRNDSDKGRAANRRVELKIYRTTP